MRILIFSSMALVGLLLVGLQHQQIGQLHAENATLGQSAAEAAQLKADLEKSSGDEAQSAGEIARLREENHDLLKLRNEVNQLREAKEAFEKVRAENLRLQAQARNSMKTNAQPTAMQPILIPVNGLFDRGFSTPEFAVQTFFWAQREGNIDDLSRCVLPKHVPEVRQRFERGYRPKFEKIVSIEIVARRELDVTTVQIGIQIHAGDDPQRDRKQVFTLVLRNGEWKLYGDYF